MQPREATEKKDVNLLRSRGGATALTGGGIPGRRPVYREPRPDIRAAVAASPTSARADSGLHQAIALR